MKKFLVCLIIAVSFISLACGTTDQFFRRPVITGEVTQEKIDDALGQIYANYRSKLDMTGAQNYTVVRGDSLAQITRQHYGSLSNVGTAGTGNGFYFPVVMMASDSHIVDPDLIEPGMVLTIIDLRRNLDNPVSRQAIKDCLKDVAYIYNRKDDNATETGLTRLSDSL